MASPLPPRPNKEVEVKKPEEYLSDRTIMEQQAGKAALKLSRERFEAEQEAGRKSVELNEQRMARKAK
jgi:hypothetical protein